MKMTPEFSCHTSCGEGRVFLWADSNVQVFITEFASPEELYEIEIVSSKHHKCLWSMCEVDGVTEALGLVKGKYARVAVPFSQFDTSVRAIAQSIDPKLDPTMSFALIQGDRVTALPLVESPQTHDQRYDAELGKGFQWSSQAGVRSLLARMMNQWDELRQSYTGRTDDAVLRCRDDTVNQAHINLEQILAGLVRWEAKYVLEIYMASHSGFCPTCFISVVKAFTNDGQWGFTARPRPVPVPVPSTHSSGMHTVTTGSSPTGPGLSSKTYTKIPKMTTTGTITGSHLQAKAVDINGPSPTFPISQPQDDSQDTWDT